MATAVGTRPHTEARLRRRQYRACRTRSATGALAARGKCAGGDGGCAPANVPRAPALKRRSCGAHAVARAAEHAASLAATNTRAGGLRAPCSRRLVRVRAQHVERAPAAAPAAAPGRPDLRPGRPTARPQQPGAPDAARRGRTLTRRCAARRDTRRDAQAASRRGGAAGARLQSLRHRECPGGTRDGLRRPPVHVLPG